eukprot:TRINITY_DN12601_c0_g1_i1.p1 TRINITY_DN12601_c0_g1~~TRINITY_DN12601_c0_g1_i1.p1  ORF type:complete len:600 (+),score=172.00 TRINITY_DN12601_c0_g1_i1:31-1830(+)
MKRYLAYFGSNQYDFRLPELEAVAKVFNINFKYDKEVNVFDTPFVEVFVDSEEDLIKIASRSVTLKAFYEIFGSGKNYDEVIDGVKKYIATFPDDYAQYSREDRSFKFLVDGHNKKLAHDHKIAKIHSFKFMDLKSVVNLENPTDIFAIFEDYRRNDKNTPVRIFMCRQVVLGRRDLIDVFSLKKREYLGITSMDSELSLIGANMALAREGTMVIDPFVGTGSLVITCAHFGSMTMGGDIDASALTGKEEGKNVFTNFGQYNVRDRLVDVMRFDHHKNDVIRSNEWFDAIVCDPPYGIRAGAKKIGKKKKMLNWIPKTDPSSRRTDNNEHRYTLQQLVDMDNSENNKENTSNTNDDEKKDSEQKQENVEQNQEDNEDKDDDEDSASEDKEDDESEKKDEKETSSGDNENVPEDQKNNPYYNNKNRAEILERRKKARNQRMREKMKEKKQKKYYANKALKEKGEYVPMCVPYSVVELLSDLLGFAARTLVVGGRLVYWLPTTAEYKDSDLPQHPCFKVVANSEQPLSSKYSRRLITVEKVIAYDEAAHGNLPQIKYALEEEPAHANLAMKVLRDVNRHDKRNELNHVKPKYEEVFGNETK